MRITPANAAQGKKQPAIPTRGQARFAFSVLLAINILNYADRYVLPAVAVKVQADLRLSNTELGLLFSSFLLVYACATLPLGLWADRSIRKNIVAACVGIWSVATAISGFAQNLGQLFSLRAVLGIGEAGYAPASLSLLGDYFFPAQRGRILSYWSAGTLIGAAVGFTIGGLVADSLGWRWAFYIVGIPGLIAAFLAWRMIEPTRGAFDTEPGEGGTVAEADSTEEIYEHKGNIGKDFWETLKHLFKIPTYWTLLCALTFSFFTIGGTSVWLPKYMGQTFGLKASHAGLISGAVLVSSGLVGTIVGGWLADYAHRRRPEGRLLIVTLGFFLGAPLVFSAFLVQNLSLFIVIFVLAGIALNFCLGPLNAVTQDIIAPNLRATAIGLLLLLAHLLGDAAAPIVIGTIADKSTLGFALVLTAPLSLLIAGLISLVGLRTVASDMHQMHKHMHSTD